MMSLIRIVTTAALISLCALSFVSNARAQLCGGSFVQFTVLDSRGKSVPDVTIELLGEMPYEAYRESKYEEPIALGNRVNVKLSRDVEEMVRQLVPLDHDADFCHNPFKQRANSTKVRDVEEFVHRGEGSAKHFGFCTSENYSQVLLLKISAPGYITNYYLGRYLGGCWHGYEFVLSRDDPKLEPSGVQRPV